MPRRPNPALLLLLLLATATCTATPASEPSQGAAPPRTQGAPPTPAAPSTATAPPPAAPAAPAPTHVRAPTSDVPGFWTADELRRIDEGLAVVNASRKDLGFQKQPIDDPFRLDVVRAALDDPLSIGREAAAWDTTARDADPAAVLLRALDVLGSSANAEPGRVGVDPPEPVDGLPAAVADALNRLPRALAAYASMCGGPEGGNDVASLLREALLSQVETPRTTIDAPDLDDATFLARVPSWPRATQQDTARRALQEVANALSALRVLPPEALDLPHPVRWKVGDHEIVVYGAGDDEHPAENAVLVLDLGGNDTYLRGASANALNDRPLQVVIDLDGNDRYVGGNDLSFGGALGGVAIHWDCGAGNDVYQAGHASLGAGILGVGMLIDEGGDDVFRAKDFCEGAGAFGIGILLKKGGTDLYHADRYGQGYASTWGCGVLADTGGNDTYDAGGAHVHAPLYRDRYQSLSQGFAIGNRPVASGGVGVLVDLAGNDRYVADIYAQGSSYWYSLGLLIDDDGNDTYVAGQYSCGAGIHLSAGMLFDRVGNDSYHCMNGVGVGGAHDFAVGLLIDRQGEDHYSGSGASQGCGHTNSVGILLDSAGDDGYCAVRGLTQGDASWVRNTGGIGLLLDGAGKDVYSEPTRDGTVWTRGTLGAGLDEPSPSVATGEPQAATISKEDAEKKVDEAGKVEKDGARVWDLDKLWALACEWEVNDNRVIVPIAREKLWGLGRPALERAFEKLGSGSTGSGLEFRGVEATLQHFAETDRAAVVTRLVEKTRDADVAVRKGAVNVLATLKADEALPRFVEMLETDEPTRRGVLAGLAAMKKAPPIVATLLHGKSELEGVNAAVCLGAQGDEASVAALFGALGEDTPFLVRTAATEQLALLSEKSVVALTAIARDAKASVTARRNALRALGRSKHPDAVDPIVENFQSDDRWIRLSAFLAAKALAETANETDKQEVLIKLEAARSEEKDPLLKRLTL